jgi:hypothetical protein
MKAAMKKRRVEKGTYYPPGGPAERDLDTGTISMGPYITRSHAKSGDLAVLRVDQSPMNAKRWTLTLSCGHEIWVTSQRKPVRKTAGCPTCAKDLP